MKILYNQPIQIAPDYRSVSKKVTHIIANTIQFSKDTPVYVMENNITLKQMKNLIKKFLLEKKINKIIKTAKKKYSNHVCTGCEYCGNEVNYYLKKLNL